MDIADLIGIVGGIAGLVALGIEGYNLWKKRSPQLKIFAPYSFTGDNAGTGERMLFVLIRIANSSERVAHLYLETTSAEILYRNRWYPVGVVSFAKDAQMNFDLPENVQVHAGIKSFKFFDKFDSAVVSLDNPYSRYVGLRSHSAEALNNAERIRFVIYDCNLQKYIVETEILKNDPEHIGEKK